MKFEFKGQTYEVDENNVMFSVDASRGITSLTFRKPVELKPRWGVILTTRNVGDTDLRLLFESDDYDACRSVFNMEKERLVKQLIMTETDFRLKVSGSFTPAYMTFSIVDEHKAIEQYLKLTK